MKNNNSKDKPNSTQNRLLKTQVPPRPENNEIIRPVDKKMETIKYPPRAGSSQKLEYKVQDNMTQSKISAAKNGLQLLKKKMSRNGMSRQKPNSSFEKKEQIQNNPPVVKKATSKIEKKQEVFEQETYKENAYKEKEIKKVTPKVTMQKNVEDLPIKKQPYSSDYVNPNQEIPISQKPDFNALLEREIAKENGMNQNKAKPAKQKYNEPNEEVKIELIECSKGCGRQFNETAIEKHQKICEKVFQTKRKAFDSAAARQPDVEGFQKPIEVPSKFNQKNAKKSTKNIEQKKEKIPKWKLESAQLRVGLKAGKNVQLTAEEKKITQMQIGITQCNFCGRKFNEKAAIRHIPFCEAKSKQLPKMNVSKKR